MPLDEKQKKIQESTVLRGICASIQAMKFPSFDNLIELMKENGYKVTITELAKPDETL